MAAKLGMEFRTKVTWDAKFSPIRDADFVRAQMAEASIAREEYEQEHGEQLQSKTAINLGTIPKSIGKGGSSIAVGSFGATSVAMRLPTGCWTASTMKR